MSKLELENFIISAQRMTENLLVTSPNDHRLIYARNQLEKIKERIQSEWPLRDPQKATGQIGLFAVRELEGSHDELATLLERIDYCVEHPDK